MAAIAAILSMMPVIILLMIGKLKIPVKLQVKKIA